MSSVSTPTATKRPDPALLALLVLCIVVATAYVAVAVEGGKLPPTPINLLVLTTLGTTVVCAVVVRVASQLGAHLGAQMSAQSAHTNRRLEVLISAVVKHGASLAEATGEIPRITTAPAIGQAAVATDGDGLDAYSRGYADGLARQPLPPTKSIRMLPPAT